MLFFQNFVMDFHSTLMRVMTVCSFGRVLGTGDYVLLEGFWVLVICFGRVNVLGAGDYVLCEKFWAQVIMCFVRGSRHRWLCALWEVLGTGDYVLLEGFRALVIMCFGMGSGHWWLCDFGRVLGTGDYVLLEGFCVLVVFAFGRVLGTGDYVILEGIWALVIMWFWKGSGQWWLCAFGRVLGAGGICFWKGSGHWWLCAFGRVLGIGDYVILKGFWALVIMWFWRGLGHWWLCALEGFWTFIAWRVIKNVLTLWGNTGLRLRLKYWNLSPFLWTCTLSPSYLISEYMPFGHFLKAYSTDLHGSACNYSQINVCDNTLDWKTATTKFQTKFNFGGLFFTWWNNLGDIHIPLHSESQEECILFGFQTEGDIFTCS